MKLLLYANMSYNSFFLTFSERRALKNFEKKVVGKKFDLDFLNVVSMKDIN